jgi:hypothetical protein
VLSTFARKAAGASGARHSLRPLISEGATFVKNSRELRGEIAKSYLAVIASAAKQSIRQTRKEEWIASLRSQ